MGKKCIVFFDIDGTLVDRNINISKTTREAVFELKAQGHVVGIATGRAPYMFEHIRKELDIHTFVSFNGQLVVVDDRVIYSSSLNREALSELTRMASSNHHPLVYVGQYQMKANVIDHDYITESLAALQLESPEYGPDFYHNRDIFQSMIFLKEQEESQYIEKFKEFRFIRWHPLSVDIDPAEGSKAKGIEKVLEYLGFPLNQLYAFGDGLNDIEMLMYAPNSIAMGNAHPLVKKAAKYITKSVDEDGILLGLKMVGLL